MRMLTRAGLLGMVLVTAAACSRIPPLNQPTAAPSTAPVAAPAPGEPAPSEPAVRSIPLRTAASSVADPPRARILRGTGNFLGAGTAPVRSAQTTATGDITLNFVNATVKEVAKAVLGGILRLNYEVDPKVNSSVTMETSQPLGRDAVLPVFEQSLRLAGLALVHHGDIYRIVPGAEAPRQSGSPVVFTRPDQVQRGYGVTIVPLRYVGAAEMQQLIEPLSPAGGILKADAQRNILMIAGTEKERLSILENIAVFDVNQMAGMSFALFRPRALDAASLKSELDMLLSGAGGGGPAGMVRLIALDRLNAVLAISPQAAYLKELTGWVERLDQVGESREQRLYVYPVQNGRAADLASVLSRALKGTDDTAGKATPAAAVKATAREATARSVPAAATDLPVLETEPEAQDTPFRKLRITADPVNNALVFLATAREYAIVEAALRHLDLPPLQILLEAAVLEVTLTDQLKYGVQYLLKSGGSQAVLSGAASTAIRSTLPGFSYVFDDLRNINAIVSALDSITHVEVISAPQVLALNNQTAKLQVGDQVPVATQQSQSTATANAPIVNTITYMDTGVILEVTPRVNQGGMILMDVLQEVSDVATTTSSTLNSPTISERKITSTIAVRDGETVALGGLIRDSRSKGKDGVPYLHEIPVLGWLFGVNDTASSRTELLVLITPHIIDSVPKSRAITDELRRKLPHAASLLPRVR